VPNVPGSKRKENSVLQDQIVKRIDHLNHLRLLYAVHLALYGVMLAGSALVAAFAPAHWQLAVLGLLLWLPLMLSHTMLQTLYEARQRCTTYQLAPAEAFNRTPMLPVDLYDDQGNLLGSGDQFTLLPPPRV
jgi:hypothetical protein